MFNFLKKQAISTRANDEILYEYVFEELEANIKKKGLWAKAYANSDGDESKVEPLYMQYRVQAIKDVFTSLEIMYSELPKSTVIDLLKSDFKNIKSTKVTQLKDRWFRNDEIVIDEKTGLMWQDNVEVKEFEMNWNEAHAYAEKLRLGGFEDWRVPSKDELATIIEKNWRKDRIYSVFDNVVSNYYWSSTTYADSSIYAWRIHFDNGYQYHNLKSLRYYVRCVRAG